MLQKEVQRMGQYGRSTGLYYGEAVKGKWWRPRNWAKVLLSPFLRELLEPIQKIVLLMEAELLRQNKELEESITEPLPVGLGKLTDGLLTREVCSWERFANRRQVGSYTGLCPGEDSSGPNQFRGTITKHGNPRVRHLLIECVWRFFYYQPHYHALEKWKERLMEPHLTKPKKKKIVVAVARQLAVDLWRLHTGRCTAEELGLKMSA